MSSSVKFENDTDVTKKCSKFNRTYKYLWNNFFGINLYVSLELQENVNKTEKHDIVAQQPNAACAS